MNATISNPKWGPYYLVAWQAKDHDKTKFHVAASKSPLVPGNPDAKMIQEFDSVDDASRFIELLLNRGDAK